MNNTEHKVELLAPAGSMEALLGAIHAGADAVYVGGEKFSARAYADNLNTENLCSCIRYAHLFGRRVYLTLNTLIKESEFAGIYDFVKPLYEAGLDGVIIQDFGVLSFLRREFPGLLLHASTQMAITGSDIVPWCLEHGISRIVPARELSLEELKEVRDAGIEVECFIHGAMCYCYSGMCLMSSILGGRSGNRGRCAQPCRLPYEAEGNGFHAGESYPLSLKDMCTIDHLPQLMEAGMTSFKIEGRMKRSEYAAGVTAVYRKYIDLYYAHPDQPFRISSKDRKMLYGLYIRSDAQDGYLFRQNGPEMVTMSKPGYEEGEQELLDRIRFEHLGKKLTYPVSMKADFRKGKAAGLCLRAEINAGLNEACTDGKTSVVDVNTACTNAKPFAEVKVTGPVVERAQKLPAEDASVRKQLSRLGNTNFTLEDLEITMESDVFLPNGMLNQLRRDGIARLEEAIIDGFFPGLRQRKAALPEGKVELPDENRAKPDTREALAFSGREKGKPVGSETGLSVLVSTPEQLKAGLSHPLSGRLHYLYLTEECLDVTDSDLVRHAGPLLSDRCVLVLPAIARSKDKTHLSGLIHRASRLGIRHLLVRNLEELGMIRQLGADRLFRLIADASLYCWNQEAKQSLLQDFGRITLPYELNSREISSLNDEKTEHVIYGYIPLMQSANCLYRTCGDCRLQKQQTDTSSERIHSCLNQASVTQTVSADRDSCELHGMAVLTDRLGKHFRVLTDCRYCFNTIYNSVPLSLHNKIGILKGGNYRLQFTVESAREMTAVLDYYQSWITDPDGKKPAAFPVSEFTTAHENRQVE